MGELGEVRIAVDEKCVYRGFSWDGGGAAKWDSEREREVTERPHPSACADLVQESQEPEGVEMSLNDKPPNHRKPLSSFPKWKP